MAIRPGAAKKAPARTAEDAGGVTLTIQDLRAEVSGAASRSDARLSRLLAVVSESILQYASQAPAAIQNEAACRLCAYLLNCSAGTVRRGEVGNSASVEFVTNHAPFFRNSGAAALLAPWRVRRAGVV